MKTYTINIHPQLQSIEVTVRNGALFQRSIIEGSYRSFNFTTNPEDAEKIKSFAVKFGNDKSSNKGNWYAHCNGYAMDLTVTQKGNSFSINTYRPYGKVKY